jgi:hypothetical protein
MYNQDTVKDLSIRKWFLLALSLILVTIFVTSGLYNTFDSVFRYLFHNVNMYHSIRIYVGFAVGPHSK